MKVSIRQLNGCLSAIQVAKINPESQKVLKKLITLLIENKKDNIEVSEDDNFYKDVIKMSAIHTKLIKVQKHNEIPRHIISA